ncbi:hypothetical protein BPAE_0299g00030 [Botrytis paeoniae]|uniref:Uncharacterized protein n=1 Tax=Botrytis paeoniae TaxID=278948 RepID=A0A4Z1FAS3_9HELO|nr:hypothetical protein BPAE_0299g00030 [Botrytis paeoniae]
MPPRTNPTRVDSAYAVDSKPTFEPSLERISDRHGFLTYKTHRHLLPRSIIAKTRYCPNGPPKIKRTHKTSEDFPEILLSTLQDDRMKDKRIYIGKWKNAKHLWKYDWAWKRKVPLPHLPTGTMQHAGCQSQ